VKELSKSSYRVLVATDCLSEGINLQEAFNAVVHYDLPWNPNRLEQREGRVDRFGQTRSVVRTVLLYGRDNPIDGAVLDVLLRIRFLMETRGVEMPMLAEECVVLGFRGRPEALEWLEESDAIALLEQAEPGGNVTEEERTRGLEEALSWLTRLQARIEALAEERAERLRVSHRRVRRITREGILRVRPQLPVDVLGVYVLLPVPRGMVARSL
jgi:superfamily II DNA/RNA helicase